MTHNASTCCRNVWLICNCLWCNHVFRFRAQHLALLWLTLAHEIVRSSRIQPSPLYRIYRARSCGTHGHPTGGLTSMVVFASLYQILPALQWCKATHTLPMGHWRWTIPMWCSWSCFQGAYSQKLRRHTGWSPTSKLNPGSSLSCWVQEVLKLRRNDWLLPANGSSPSGTESWLQGKAADFYTATGPETCWPLKDGWD